MTQILSLVKVRTRATRWVFFLRVNPVLCRSATPLMLLLPCYRLTRSATRCRYGPLVTTYRANIVHTAFSALLSRLDTITLLSAFLAVVPDSCWPSTALYARFGPLFTHPISSSVNKCRFPTLIIYSSGNHRWCCTSHSSKGICASLCIRRMYKRVNPRQEIHQARLSNCYTAP